MGNTSKKYIREGNQCREIKQAESSNKKRKGKMNSAHVHNLRPEEWYASAGSQSGCHLTLVTLWFAFEVQTLVKPSRIVSNWHRYLWLAALATSECFMSCWIHVHLIPCFIHAPTQAALTYLPEMQTCTVSPFVQFLVPKTSLRLPGVSPAWLCSGCSRRKTWSQLPHA